MKNSLARQILAETPPETRQFVRRYGQLVTRIADLMEERGWSQKDLAEKMGKSPSEISKWLSGEHNLTLRTLAKLEVELGEDIFSIPKSTKFKVHSSKVIKLITSSNSAVSTGGDKYTTWEKKSAASLKSSVA
jgi:transcriptional regulator with XRE-family HTH domain